MRVVGIGGGHGLAVTLRAARFYASDVGAVVTVADDGGSSGRLTRELGVPPPGDIRNCLVALADGGELADLYQYRFRRGTLSGHTVGNLVIAALAERMGDFAGAVAEAGHLLGTKGCVYPATTALVELHASTDDGVLRGQVAVAESRAPIRTVYLEPPDPPAHDGAVRAIACADQVVLGPGSLFTSLIATLAVPGIAHALSASRARRVFVCNARGQAGETHGLSAGEHARALLEHAGPTCIDSVVVQAPTLEGGVPVDRGALEDLGLEVVEADVATEEGHDPPRLARVLAVLT
ncbi:hypothetical protein BH18ACT15_BH18ACT15_08320 [soil metagenome]